MPNGWLQNYANGREQSYTTPCRPTHQSAYAPKPRRKKRLSACDEAACFAVGKCRHPLRRFVCHGLCRVRPIRFPAASVAGPGAKREPSPDRGCAADRCSAGVCRRWIIPDLGSRPRLSSADAQRGRRLKAAGMAAAQAKQPPRAGRAFARSLRPGPG
jgi:hypothetical protein